MKVSDARTEVWRKSTYSDSSGGNCVEVAVIRGAIGMRDSKNPDTARLAVGRAAFGTLVRGLKAKTLL